MSTSRQRTGLTPANLPDLKQQQIADQGYSTETGYTGFAQAPEKGNFTQTDDFTAIYARKNPITGEIENARLSGVEKLLEKYGVVANGTTDDASNLQEAINAARATWGGAFPIPTSINTIKINSGITLNADTDRLVCDRPVVIDASGVTSGQAILVTGTISDGNTAALRCILNHMAGIRLIGAGSPTVAGAPGVVGIRFRGINGGGKAYFYQAKQVSVDGFEVNVDLGGACFGIAFEDFIGRAAMGGTVIRCLTGDGADYGERFNFTRAMIYNSALGLLNTNSATTFRFINSSFDYNTVMADVQAGRLSLVACHVETNQDTDYMFKVSGNEASAIDISQSEIVINGVDKTAFAIANVDSAVKFGGFTVRDSMISHGAGYHAHTYVDGDGPAIASGIRTFVSQWKPPFSRYQNKIMGHMDSAAALAQFTLTGSVLPVISTTVFNEGTGSMYFGPSTAASQAEIVIPVEADRHPRCIMKYRKQNSTVGQGNFQITGAWLDANGTVIGSTIELLLRTDNADWTSIPANINAPKPAGARSYRYRFIKQADTGNTAQLWLDDIVITTV